ncbi:hypothetical protein [Cohnella nanjingensis]|uniref:Uncharacterized protein n=1 Tax=Cohnella nanjingensis TaxID=1387779 RepID=A0A7X0VI43_9BACL|nr:hypothetical protein [Cohnella nanjingensis]MBB6673269.1 hypothetical protein [Cohnella nanjingensis]
MYNLFGPKVPNERKPAEKVVPLQLFLVWATLTAKKVVHLQLFQSVGYTVTITVSLLRRIARLDMQAMMKMPA